MQEIIRRFKDGVWFTCRPVDNGTFYIFWSEQRRSKRESTSSKEVAAASAFLDEWLSLRGAPKGAVLTCADLWALKYGLATDRPRHAWAHLEPVFGALRPLDVTQALVDDYLARRRRAARPSTIRYEVSCLYASWNAAVKRRTLTAADLPVLDPPPPGSPPRERWLTDAEIARALETVRGPGPRLSREERFVAIALDACARRTAICELRWEQVDFEAGIIHFNPEGREQTRKRRASVPMSKRLRLVLERAHAEQRGPWVLDGPSKINHTLARRLRAAGLEKVSPHTFRHTAATHMARRGVPLWIIAQLLGNTLEQVERVYAKFAPDFGREAVEAISGGSWSKPRIIGES